MHNVETLTAHYNHAWKAPKYRSLLDLPRVDRPTRSDPGHGRAPRVRADEQARIVTAYAAGDTLLQIARREGRHKETISKTLKRAGVQPRYQLLGQDEVAAGARLYAEGLSLKRVGQRLGVDAETVRTAFREAGVPVRRRNGW